jgi:hypothetical protein
VPRQAHADLLPPQVPHIHRVLNARGVDLVAAVREGNSQYLQAEEEGGQHEAQKQAVKRRRPGTDRHGVRVRGYPAAPHPAAGPLPPALPPTW